MIATRSGYTAMARSRKSLIVKGSVMATDRTHGCLARVWSSTRVGSASEFCRDGYARRPWRPIEVGSTGAAQITLLGRFEVSVDGRSHRRDQIAEGTRAARPSRPQPGTVVADRQPDRSDLARRLSDPTIPRELCATTCGTSATCSSPTALIAPKARSCSPDRPATCWRSIPTRSTPCASRRSGLGPQARRRPAPPARLAGSDCSMPGVRRASPTRPRRGPLAEAAVRLDRLRSTVLADRISADIALGRDAELIPELEQLVATHPFDERLRGQLMLALYRAGRQTDALAVFAATRTLLVEELGVEPGPELRDLEQPHPAPRRRPWCRRSVVDPAAAPRSERRRTRICPIRWTPSSDATTNSPSFTVSSASIGWSRSPARAAPARLAWRSRSARRSDRRSRRRRLAGGARARCQTVQWCATLSPSRGGSPTADSDVEDVVVAVPSPRASSLLVLDNCEHVHDAASALVAPAPARSAGRADPGNLTRVAGRAPAKRSCQYRASAGADRVGFRVQQSRCSSIAGAPRARLGRRPAGDDAEAIDRICARLDGIPLGLELAAGRLRSMDPSEIADHLDHSLGLLAVARSTGCRGTAPSLRPSSGRTGCCPSRSK